MKRTPRVLTFKAIASLLIYARNLTVNGNKAAGRLAFHNLRPHIAPHYFEAAPTSSDCGRGNRSNGELVLPIPYRRLKSCASVKKNPAWNLELVIENSFLRVFSWATYPFPSSVVFMVGFAVLIECLSTISKPFLMTR
jgi:hypothetical protein